MKSEAWIIWKWQYAENLAKELGIDICTNASSTISIIEKGKFLFNGETVAEASAFMEAIKQERE